MATTAGWERWLLPDRPGSRQFIIAVVAWLLPLAFLHTSEGTDPRALIASVVIGCGLGLGWLAAAGWRWLRTAPVTTCIVLLTCFASAANLELVPRWDALVRARHAADAGEFYLQQRTLGGSAELPTYGTGIGRRSFSLDQDGAGGMRCLYTSEPIMRWSVRGWRPACFVVVLKDGTSLVVRTRDRLEETVLARTGAPLPP